MPGLKLKLITCDALTDEILLVAPGAVQELRPDTEEDVVRVQETAHDDHSTTFTVTLTKPAGTRYVVDGSKVGRIRRVS